MNNSVTLPLPLGINLPSPVKTVKTKLSSASQAFQKYSSRVSDLVAASKETKRLKSETKLTPLQEAFAYEVAVALEEAYPIYGSLCAREYNKSDVHAFRIDEQTLRLATEEAKSLSPYLLQVARVPFHS